VSVDEILADHEYDTDGVLNIGEDCEKVDVHVRDRKTDDDNVKESVTVLVDDNESDEVRILVWDNVLEVDGEADNVTEDGDGEAYDKEHDWLSDDDDEGNRLNELENDVEGETDGVFVLMCENVMEGVDVPNCVCVNEQVFWNEKVHDGDDDDDGDNENEFVQVDWEDEIEEVGDDEIKLVLDMVAVCVFEALHIIEIVNESEGDVDVVMDMLCVCLTDLVEE
jgi:hypothetical protein